MAPKKAPAKEAAKPQQQQQQPAKPEGKQAKQQAPAKPEGKQAAKPEQKQAAKPQGKPQAKPQAKPAAAAPAKPAASGKAKKTKSETSGVYVRGLNLEGMNRDSVAKLFNTAGNPCEVRIRRRGRKGTEDGYVILFYRTAGAQKKALEMNGKVVKGNKLSVVPAKAKPTPDRKTYCTSVWIGGVPGGTNRKQITDLFRKAGKVIRVRVYNSRKTAFAYYTSTAHAVRAVKMFNNFSLRGEHLRVKLSIRTKERDAAKAIKAGFKVGKSLAAQAVVKKAGAKAAKAAPKGGKAPAAAAPAPAAKGGKQAAPAAAAAAPAPAPKGGKQQQAAAPAPAPAAKGGKQQQPAAAPAPAAKGGKGQQAAAAPAPAAKAAPAPKAAAPAPKQAAAPAPKAGGKQAQQAPAPKAANKPAGKGKGK